MSTFQLLSKLKKKLFFKKKQKYMLKENYDINEIKDIINTCNVNFLIGSGLSTPYMETLGKIESLLSEVNEINQDISKKVILYSLYRKYFLKAISKNPNILKEESDCKLVLNNYVQFIKVLNTILSKRKSTIINKQVNLFTTNIDVFLEKALDTSKVEYNDGFSGKLNPIFDINNFKKTSFKTSLFFDNSSEIPTFNLLKLHGSVTWESKESNEIYYTSTMEFLKKLEEIHTRITDECFCDVLDDDSIDNLIKKVAGKIETGNTKEFLCEYDKLLIVNPTDEKFKLVSLNRTYYGLLRQFSNELEKPNTVLFASGFSFADKHIQEYTLGAANSNPTLRVYIFAYSTYDGETIKSNIQFDKVKNNNIKIITPATDKNSNDAYKFNFVKLLELFNEISLLIDKKKTF